MESRKLRLMGKAMSSSDAHDTWDNTYWGELSWFYWGGLASLCFWRLFWIEWFYTSSDAFGGYYLYYDSFCLRNLEKERRTKKAEKGPSEIFYVLPLMLLGIKPKNMRLTADYWVAQEDNLMRNEKFRIKSWEREGVARWGI